MILERIDELINEYQNKIQLYTNRDSEKFTKLYSLINIDGMIDENDLASYTAFSGEYVMTQTQTQVNAYDIILMPQEFIFKNENGEVIGYSDAEIVINYSVNGTDQTPSVVKLSDLTEKWEIGKRYTYNITLGYDLILVGATVEKWEENGINTPIS